jgi:mannose-6-phosphate isomerase
VTKERLLAAIASRTLEDLLQSHEVRRGDTFFIPAGMPHSIGPNMVVCEVQQYSDLTYRIYDYGRRDADGKLRELHVEKAMQVVNFNLHAGAKVEPRALLVGNQKLWEELVACPYFATLKFEFQEPIHMSANKSSEEFSLWVFLEGEGNIGWSSAQQGMFGSRYSGQFPYKSGECWFIPAEFSGRGYYPKSKTSLLIATPRNPKHTAKKMRDAN